MNNPPKDLHRAKWAAWSEPTATPEPKRTRLISWKPLRRNSLIGFATVELPIGLVISDIPVLTSHNKIWAAPPSKPQLDKDGQQRRDIKGKPAYTPILQWRDKDLANRFSDAVVALIRAEYSDDLGGAL